MTVIKRSRKYVLRTALLVFMHRYMKHLAQGYVADKVPQVAIFSFDVMGTAISLFGRYERDELDILSHWLEERSCGDGACVDVGANVGNHALFFASRFSKVYAFEPNPQTYKLLQVNAAQAGNIGCFNCGLSDHHGKVDFVSPSVINSGVGYILLEGGSYPPDTKIDVVPLDDVEDVKSQKLSLLKIDVEGHELQVFKGAKKLIARDRPVVIFEQGGGAFSGGTSPCIEFLRSLGYRRFFAFEKAPQYRNQYLTVAARLLWGERIAVKEVDRFESKMYPMIIAAPD